MTYSKGTPVPHKSLGQFTEFAQMLASHGGDIIRSEFRSTSEYMVKEDLSPVTIVDQNIEKAQRLLINKHFPDHGILGEEYGLEREHAEYVWLLDPIDGTKAFVAGLNSFASLISLTRNGNPILGIIDQPITNERWIGVKGTPTTFNGKEIKVRTCPALMDAVLATSAPDNFNEEGMPAFNALHAATRWTVYGGSCLLTGMLATGFIDIVAEGWLDPYDYCPIVPIVEGAGGVISDFRGEPLNLYSDRYMLASGDRKMHERAIDTMKF